MRNVLRDFNVFVGGLSYLGKTKEYVPPSLNVPGEAYRAAGMDAPVSIDLGMDEMEAAITFGQYDPQVFRESLRLGATTQIDVRGALTNLDGSVVSIVHTLSGRISGLEQPAWSPGAMSDPKITIKPNYFRVDIGAETVIEIDVQNCVRIIGGVDQMAEIRSAIGA